LLSGGSGAKRLYRWERAAQIDPTYAAAQNNLAIAYEHEGDLDKARAAYEKALELEPNNAFIKQNYELFRKSMTARAARILSSLGAVVLTAACTSYYEIPIETPIRPKLDVSAFQRVLVAGFISGGTDDVDGNLETTRLLRSQLRTKSEMRVIDTDVLPADGRRRRDPGTGYREGNRDDGRRALLFRSRMTRISSRTSTCLLTRVLEKDRRGISAAAHRHRHRDVRATAARGHRAARPEVYDSLGRRRVVPTRTYMERKGFVLKPRFIFIDGRTGAVLHSENFREEILYNANQTTPALSSYSS
jgi:hypothetical protein